MKTILSFISLILICLSAISCKTIGQAPIDGTVQGIVFDLDKSPVRDAAISLSHSENTWSATTNAQGRFTFTNIPKGKFSLAFSKEQFEARTWPIEITNYMDVIYLEVSNYWQLLDSTARSLAQGKLNESEDFLVRAQSIQTESPTYFFLSGVLAEKRNDNKMAIQYIEQAIKIDVKSPYLWLYLADLYEHEGSSKGQIVQSLQRYLELRDDPSIAERVKQLSQ